MIAHLLLLGSTLLAPAPDTAAPKVLNAVRVPAGQAPALDGRLDDAIWATAPAAADFVQRGPDPGRPATQRTEARVVYDNSAIYVGVRMYDTHPDSIAGQLARRDVSSGYSDWVHVGIDSRHDRRTAFRFSVNPRGVKQDVFHFDDTNEDKSWDAVWEVATATDSLGWTAEFRIPLSQLRFSPSGGAQTWGINFAREIARRGETAFWSPVLPNVNGIISRSGELHGLSGLTSPRRLELQPYSLARLTRAPGDASNPFYRENDPYASAGVDLKYGITSDFTLTATLNPDFGQVEADPAQVNLSAYETFYREQRPFFVEGVDIFRFGIGAGDGDFGSESLFYSRRIGRAPQRSAGGLGQYVDAPSATRILGAAKLSGKTANGWSVGILDAVTAEEQARYIDGDGSELRATTEPRTNYAVARVRRDFRKGQSAVGAVLTSTHRALPDDGNLNWLPSQAYAGGIDARHRFGGGNYELRTWLLGSQVEGDSAAILRLQRAPARFFQRPDADHLRELYEPGRTALGGWAASTELYKTGGGNWSYGGILNVRSPGFDTNDLGYQRNADQVVQALFGSYYQPRAGKVLRNWRIGANQWAGSTFGGERTGLGGNVNGGFQLANFWSFNGGINREMETWSIGALRGGPALLAPGNVNGWMGISSDSRKRVRGSLNSSVWLEDGTNGQSFHVGSSVSVRPSTQADLSLGPSFSRRTDEWQYVRRVGSGDAARFQFAQLDQTTAALTARVNYTFTPTLSLQLYGQPFVSAGDYSGLKEVTDPRAERFQDRFQPAEGSLPDFNYKAFRSNAVLRWEYRPGSTMFVVWSQGRDHFAEDGSFAARRDFGRLFNPEFAPSTNVLLVKFSYWLNL